MLSGVPNLALAVRLHERVVDAQVRPHVRVRVPAAQPHGRARLRALHAGQRRPVGRPRSRSSTSPPATCSARSHQFPKQGSRAPWRLHQNYALDMLSLRRAQLDDGALRFARARALAARYAPRRWPPPARRRRCRASRSAAGVRVGRRAASDPPGDAAGLRRAPRRQQHLPDARAPRGPVSRVAAVRRLSARPRGAAGARARAADPAHRLQLRLGIRVGTARAHRGSARDRARGDPAHRRRPRRAGWSPADATLLRAADELHAQAKISDGTWAPLGESYDERGLMEIAMLVGHYHMVAFALNSAEVRARRRAAGPALGPTPALGASAARRESTRASAVPRQHSASMPSRTAVRCMLITPTEREGFEPSNEVSPVTRFPVAPVQPLRHLSSACRRARGPAGPSDRRSGGGS